MNPLAAHILFKRHLKLAALSAVFLCGTASSVHAGFEWVPATPRAQAAPAVSAPPPAAPAPRVIAEPPASALTPVAPPPAPVMQTREFYEEKAVEPVAKSASKPMPISTLSSADNDAAPAVEEVIVEKALEETASVTAPPIEAKTVTIKRNVVVPDNAPESALERIQTQDVVVKARTAKAAPVAEDVATPAPSMSAVKEERAPNAVNAEPAQKPAPQDADPLEFAGSPVVGFGTDMPLALALAQIVPSTYAYAFGDGVNPGYRVSWSGGKSWVDVISDMVKPLELRVEVRGKTVYLHVQDDMANAPSVDVEKTTTAVSSAPLMSVEANDAPLLVTLSEDSPQDGQLVAKRDRVFDPGEVSLSQPAQTVEALDDKIIVSDVAAPSAPNLLWEARKGDSLKDTLDSWSALSGIELVWEADYDYRLKSDVVAAGRLENALKIVVNDAIEGDTLPAMVLVGAANDATSQAQLIIQDQPAS